MEAERSLLGAQEHSTVPYSVLDESNVQPHILFL
jgi:hypothetical protein